jgi:hypothetical protein
MPRMRVSKPMHELVLGRRRRVMQAVHVHWHRVFKLLEFVWVHKKRLRFRGKDVLRGRDRFWLLRLVPGSDVYFWHRLGFAALAELLWRLPEIFNRVLLRGILDQFCLFKFYLEGPKTARLASNG